MIDSLLHAQVKGIEVTGGRPRRRFSGATRNHSHGACTSNPSTGMELRAESESAEKRRKRVVLGLAQGPTISGRPLEECCYSNNIVPLRADVTLEARDEEKRSLIPTLTRTHT
jgi:hypothetical protein